MRFTWDPVKSEHNLRVRGLSFGDAARMWDAPMFVWVDARKDYGETRNIGVGLTGGRVMVVGWVQREDDLVHIFTFRKANAREAQRYGEFLARQDTGPAEGEHSRSH